MEINWTVLSYFVIGLFALSGFFRGWWKEAVTTALLAILVLLLQTPGLAQTIIQFVNNLLATLWTAIPDSFRPVVDSTLETALAVDTNGQPLQADPGNPGTWLMILLIFITLAILLSRFMLPDPSRRGNYVVQPSGGILGGLLGGFNGFLIINLVREYLDGRNLPTSSPPTELALSGGAQVAGRVSSGVAVTATEVPNFTILDSFLPWILVGFGLLILVAAFRSRIEFKKSDKGYRKVEYKVPYGYKKVE